MGPHATLLQSQRRRVKRLAVLGLLWLCMAFVMLGVAIALTWACPAHAQTLQTPPPAAARYRLELTRAAHSQWGLGAPIATFAAQVHTESAWQPQAISRVGAAGLAQFMPATAQWWCRVNAMPVAQCQPTNPTWALRALVGYDKHLYDRTPAYYPPHARLWVTLRAYNGGLAHWYAEAQVAASTLLPSRQLPDAARVDSACGRAKRHPMHCPENLAYPQRIMALQARYAAWGAGV